MWRRLRRRSMAPRRPMLFVDQYAHAVLTAAALLGGVALAAWAFLEL